MLTYEEMQYVTAFAEYGTLTEVAEKYSISQPTITRAMKKAEEVFQVPLFVRTKNSIRLNANGELAVREIAMLLRQTDDMILQVRAFDRANRTISVGSAAAVQLPDLVRKLSRAFPARAVAVEQKLPAELLRGFRERAYQLIVLPFDPNARGASAPEVAAGGESGKTAGEMAGETAGEAALESLPACLTRKIGEEHLMFYLPKNHPLAGRSSLALGDLNGENMLLFSDIGFWAEIVRRKMPDSRFLVQSERYSFRELVANSVLPCFTTNLFNDAEASVRETRVAVPISDPEVNVSYYLVCRRDERKLFGFLLE
jgi:DNA-binding transcriptional LysR family regulator